MTTTGIYMHRYSEYRPYRTFGICPGMINPLGYKILIELPAVGQDTIVSSGSLPLLREVLSDYTKLVSEVLKLHTRHRLSQDICNLLICANILELYSSLLYHVTNVVIPDLYVLCLIMEHWVLCHLYATLVIT
jgi:hypothetical protein